MKPLFKLDFARLERYLTLRRTSEYLFLGAKTPLKLPARRRRSDRELPAKAA